MMRDDDTVQREIERLTGLYPRGLDLTLSRITALLEKLGNPQQALPPVIHVAGTNGKGSASAFCRALLEAAGLAVHVHTSPHLVRWNERYRLGRRNGPGQFLDDERLAATIRTVEAANAGAPITVFEILAAVGFVLFSQEPADALVLEVGLGGRFDSTNVITAPAVSLIMPISFDHQAYLGDSVELIASEKAGIIKRRCPVVIGHQGFSAARDLLVETAERLRCPVSVYGQDFMAHEEFGRLVYQDEEGLSDIMLPRLAGRHQIANAAAAIRAVKAAGFTVTETMMERAMERVEWPARLQKLMQGALVDQIPDGAELWVDGGHNPGAGEVIAEAMANLEERQPRPLYLIAGMLNTKDPVGYFRPFAGIAVHVYAVPIQGSAAGLDPVVLAGAAYDAGLVAEPVSSIGEALAALSTRIGSGPAPRILIGGSLYLAGNALAENGTPPR